MFNNVWLSVSVLIKFHIIIDCLTRIVQIKCVFF